MAIRQGIRDDIPFGPTKQGERELAIPLLVGLVVVIAVIAIGVVLSLVGCHSTPSFTVATNNSNASNDDVEVVVPLVYVHVVGCVAEPGVYAIAEGSHVIDAIDQAGGFTEDADTGSLNLARTVSDGEQVRVYSIEEVQAQSSGTAPSQGISPDGLVNINLATAEELQSVSGIGAVTAQRIVDDREKNGPYSSVDDLTRVSGIGEKTVAKMRDSLTV